MSRNADTYDRRAFLRGIGAVAAVGTLAGCTGDGGGGTPTQTESPTKTSTSTPTGGGSASALDGAITVKGTEFKFTPAEFKAKKGKSLKITFKNVGSVAHNFTLGKFPLSKHSGKYQNQHDTIAAQTKTIQSGKTATVTYTPDKSGTFPYWCNVSGHRASGMKGQMKVVE